MDVEVEVEVGEFFRLVFLDHFFFGGGGGVEERNTIFVEQNFPTNFGKTCWFFLRRKEAFFQFFSCFSN